METPFGGEINDSEVKFGESVSSVIGKTVPRNHHHHTHFNLTLFTCKAAWDSPKIFLGSLLIILGSLRRWVTRVSPALLVNTLHIPLSFEIFSNLCTCS